MDLFTLGASIINGIAGGFAGQAEADAKNRAQERQDKFNKQSWQYNKRRLRADHKQDLRQWEMNIRNEEGLAAWKDATNLQDWQQQLKIQDFEYRSQMRQFAKSEQIYGQQLTFNNMAAAAAKEAEYRKLQDATNEIAYQNQDIVIKALEAEGAAAVKGQQGRSADKGEQSLMAALGRNEAILAESLVSARSDTSAALKKIANDKFGADLAAQAARMLKPERLPQAPKPLTTPRAEFLKPRNLKKFDFGPQPPKGATASAAGSWLGAVSGVASSAASAYAQSKYGG